LENLAAEVVNDAEPRFEAKDIRRDNWKRNIIVAITIGMVACVLTITLAVSLTKCGHKQTGDPMCWPPASEQSIAVRCYRSNSTGGFYDQMTEDEKYAYMSQLNFMIEHGIVDEDVQIDEDSCDPLDQDLLTTANTTSQLTSSTAPELFNRASDQFRRLVRTAYIRSNVHQHGRSQMDQE
jgi:hypothetical protein